MLHFRPTAPALAVALTLWLAAAAPAAASDLAACLDASDLLRVARVLDPDGRPVYARVTAQSDGHITRAAAIAPDGTPLAEVGARGRDAAGPDFPVSDDHFDSTMWNDLVFRNDDIVIATYAKSSTTWMQ